MDLGECGGDAAEVAAVPDELSIDELNEDERAMVGLVRDFVNREVRPVVDQRDHGRLRGTQHDPADRRRVGSNLGQRTDRPLQRVAARVELDRQPVRY